MTQAQHRARIGFAISTAHAALIALGLGVAVGLLIATAFSPDLQGFGVGVLYGLLLGAPAVVAVLVARRGVRRHYHPWLAGIVVVAGTSVVVALLFWLTQLSVDMLPVGAVTGALVALIAVAIAIWPRPRAD
jgi:O-antigen/teichoic acid export membrane protein